MPLAIAMSVTMTAAARCAYLISPGVVEWAIGLTAIVFVLLSLMNLALLISDHYDKHAQRLKKLNILEGFKSGLYVGLANPKIMLIYLLILPQFVSRDFSQQQNLKGWSGIQAL